MPQEPGGMTLGPPGVFVLCRAGCDEWDRNSKYLHGDGESHV